MRAIGEVFAVNPEVMAVTGLVMPYELETEAQLLFEINGGFGRGFERKVHRASGDEPVVKWHGGAGRFGTGANMAYRRSLFAKIGLFDPALDVGTVTMGGGNLEMFFRVLKEGYSLAYEPRAIVRHRHRRSYEHLRTQIMSNGVGLYSHFVRCAIAYPDEQAAFLRLGCWWLWWWGIRRLLKSLFKPWRIPRDLLLIELRGMFLGLFRYQQARTQAAKLAGGRLQPQRVASTTPCRSAKTFNRKPAAVRTVDLNLPLQNLDDIRDYERVKIVVTRASQLIDSFEILTQGRMLDRVELRRAIAYHVGVNAFEDIRTADPPLLYAMAMNAIMNRYAAYPEVLAGGPVPTLPDDVPVSIVIGTCDRPESLRACLKSLVSQRTKRPVEIIVVDNRPTSGLTPPVVSEFPQVVLVREKRAGSSYSRNAGILASAGTIVITTDDDVVAPQDWLEKLVAPFVRADVMAVTGNVLPLELETKSQAHFEIYGGLCRGFKRKEIGIEWFERYRWRAVPTWELGGTANSAYRHSIFQETGIGLMDEVLGQARQPVLERILTYSIGCSRRAIRSSMSRPHTSGTSTAAPMKPWLSRFMATARATFPTC